MWKDDQFTMHKYFLCGRQKFLKYYLKHISITANVWSQMEIVEWTRARVLFYVPN